MISGRGALEPTRDQLRAAALAALAEAGIVYLPAHLVLAEAGALPASPILFALPFVAVFVAAVAFGCAERGRANVPAAAAVIGVAAGLLVGRGDLSAAIVSVVVALLVAMRVVTLALRDWREPILGSIGWGAVALLIEALLSAGPFPGWRLPLALFIPAFFMASLASRAQAVWSVRVAEDARGGWLRQTLLLIGGFGAAMAAAVALGVRSGLLELVGRLLSPIASGLISLMAFVVVQLGRPLTWLVQRIGVDPEKLRELLDRLRQNAAGAGRRGVIRPTGSPLLARIVGLVLFAGIAWLLVWIMRRFRLPEQPEETESREPGRLSSSTIVSEEAPRRRGPLRRELPADTVRRWYAELLLLLERRAIPKEPSLTPGEYLPQVARAFPSCASSFEAITRAYEDVRYGHLAVPRERLTSLKDHHRAVVGTLTAAGSH